MTESKISSRITRTLRSRIRRKAPKGSGTKPSSIFGSPLDIHLKKSVNVEPKKFKGSQHDAKETKITRSKDAPPIIINNDVSLEEKNRKSEEIEIELGIWKSCFEMKANTFRTSAKKRMIQKLEKILNEINLAKGQLEHVSILTNRLKQESMERTREENRAIAELSEACAQFEQDNETIREEIELCNEETRSTSMETQKKIIFQLESYRSNLQREISGKYENKLSDEDGPSISQEEYESTIKHYRDNIAKTKKDIQKCKEEKESAIEEIEVLNWKLKHYHELLTSGDNLETQKQQPSKEWVFA